MSPHHLPTVRWALENIKDSAGGPESAAARPWEGVHEVLRLDGYYHDVKKRQHASGGFEFMFRGTAPVSALHWYTATSDLDYLDSWNVFTCGVEVSQKQGDIWERGDRGQATVVPP